MFNVENIRYKVYTIRICNIHTSEKKLSQGHQYIKFSVILFKIKLNTYN